MTVLELKSHYSKFLTGHEGKLHFAAHSHHFWPDVTRDAQVEYWDDCARLSDHKWGKIFGEVIPKVQNHVARILNLKDPKQIAFAPNTHELTSRLLSLYLGKPSLKILTTQSEFHSWRRQLIRITELPQVQVDQVTENFLTDRRGFIESFKAKLKNKPDLFFISQVFFDSGLALTLDEIIELQNSCHKETVMVVDGYHGFCAIPLDLSKLEGKIFYLGGGYKYAQAGEGAAFMVIPKGDWRPAYTGWYAEFAELSTPAGKNTGYSKDFMSFMGSTQDPSGLYRLNAVWDHFSGLGIDISRIHQHVKALQESFLKGLDSAFKTRFDLTPLFGTLEHHGHFLTFEAPSIQAAETLEKQIQAIDIIIDRRGARLRFGFGLYHDLEDVTKLCLQLKKLL